MCQKHYVVLQGTLLAKLTFEVWMQFIGAVKFQVQSVCCWAARNSAEQW